MLKKQYKKIFILISISLVLFFVFLRVNKETKSDILVNAIDATSSYSISILAGDTIAQISFQGGMSLYEVMKEAREKGQIDFKGKNYPGLGFFVSDIGSLHQGFGKNLMYYINGEEAQVGVSSFVPQDGDIISWELK